LGLRINLDDVTPLDGWNTGVPIKLRRKILDGEVKKERVGQAFGFGPSFIQPIADRRMVGLTVRDRSGGREE
jgi:hypothetical protein